MNYKHRFLVGTHTSIAGGLEKAFERAVLVGGTCMQIFTKSNRQWHARPLEQKEIDLFIATAQNSLIKPIMVHASYLINLASPDDALYEKSIQALTLELERCELLKIPYLVLHPGAHLTSQKEQGIKRIGNALNITLGKSKGNTMILLENMAGQGSTIGSTWQELADIISQTKEQAQIGICFDTCHAFVAGYDFTTPEKYAHLWHDFDITLGLKNLKAMHFNDSLKALGSHTDRHENIGKGKMGSEPFKLLCNDERFFDIPKILETPKDDEMYNDIENIKLLKSLTNSKTRRIVEVL